LRLTFPVEPTITVSVQPAPNLPSPVTEPRTVRAPADPHARAELLDALRGFALFGVCLANLFTGFGWWEDPVAVTLSPRHALPTDGAATFLMHALIEGKFYSIFSLLFGLGFALQLGRAEDRGVDALPTYRRRVRLLMAIGFAHIMLLWVGDILLFYGLMSLVLIRLRHLDDRTLLRWVAACVVLPVVTYLPTIIDPGLSLGTPFYLGLLGTATLLDFDVQNAGSQLLPIILSGDMGEWLRLNAIGAWFRFADLMFTGRPFKVLAMFLVGLLIGRHRLWERLGESTPLLARVALWGTAVGLPAGIWWALIKDPVSYGAGTWHGAYESAVYALAVAPLALGYCAVFAQLWQRPAAQRVLRLLAPAGRMALTNYLAQSIIATMIFSGFGWGFAGRIGPTWLWVMAVAVLSVQVLYSAAWLARFRFGPMEWAWRSLTYRAPQPMRVTRPTRAD
jgi:uncharacterized protein